MIMVKTEVSVVRLRTHVHTSETLSVRLAHVRHAYTVIDVIVLSDR